MLPKFAFEYMDGGCNEDVNLHKNTKEIRDAEVIPRYLKVHKGSSLKTELFGYEWDAPFGIAPIGLQGLIWPDAPAILAKAATKHNIPFCLSTISTESIEEIGRIHKDGAPPWYLLYHPTENDLRDKLIKRCENSGFDTLIVLCDVPTFGFRPRDIRNGLSMPPRWTLPNIWEILKHPTWSLNTLKHYGFAGPDFKILRPYMPPGLDMAKLGEYMN